MRPAPGPERFARWAACLLLMVAMVAAGCARRVPVAGPEAQAPPAEAEPAPAEAEEPAPPADAEPVVTQIAPPEAVPVAPPGPAFAGVPSGEVRIAVLVPLSGADAGLGRALLNAAELALFDHADERVVLVPKDTGSTEAGAEAAMRAGLAEGARVAVGPLLAASVRAAAPAARQAAVPVLAFSNDRTVAGDGVFILGLTPAQQVARVVDFAVAQGHTRFAALVPDNGYGGAVVAALHESARRAHAAVDLVEYFASGQVSVSGNEPARRLAAAARGGAFDALLIAAGGADLRALSPLLPYYDIDTAQVRLLGTALWDNPGLAAEPALIGGWFAAPPEAAWMHFRNRYRSAFGADPPRLAALGYNAVALIAALARSPSGPDFSGAALTDEAGFAGIDGIFRFRADGVAERGLAVYRVAVHAFEVLDPAPAAFGPPTL